MTPGIVDTGQHSEQESQQDQDDEDNNHHPGVTTEADFLLMMMIPSNNFHQTGNSQVFRRLVLSVRIVHLYRDGITSRLKTETEHIRDKIGQSEMFSNI